MWRALRKRPLTSSALATAIAAIVVLSIVQVTGGDAISRAFVNVDLVWVALIAGGELVAYLAYVVAYRSIACIHGHAPLSLPLVARVVVAGFGPFAVAGGFGIDMVALHALHEDERSARVRVLALGTLEWAVLAPAACVVSIILLATGAAVPWALVLPWAIGVPVGFGLALWVSRPGSGARPSRYSGRRLEWVARVLDGVGAMHLLLRHPREYAGAWLGTALYWAADIVAFYGGLRAFGIVPSVEIVILAYATGYAATRRSLPLGGAGITEFLMTYSLHWLGQPLAPALAAVIAYRAFNFLLAATPALIARRQMTPLFDAAEEFRRLERPPAVAGHGRVSLLSPVSCQTLLRRFAALSRRPRRSPR